MIVLAADIGGTNANFALVDLKKRKPKVLITKRYASKNFKTAAEIVNLFLSETKRKVSQGAFAVAGPVSKGKATLTNVKLAIDAQHIKRSTPLKKVIVMNDFEAIGYGIAVTNSNNIKVLNKGKLQKEAPKAIVGAGTGLGKGILIYRKKIGEYIPIPSEGGHGDLPSTHGISKMLAKKLKSVQYEDVLSGKGLEACYQYYAKRKKSASAISKSRHSDKNAKKAFNAFLHFYALCARNLALDVLPFGGMYLAGGIAARNIDMFTQAMVKEFTNNRIMKSLLKKIPLYVVKDYAISIEGVAHALRVQ